MILYALDHAVADLARINGSDGPVPDLHFAKAFVILNGDDLNNNNGWVEEFATSIPTDITDENMSDDSHETEGLWRGVSVGPQSKKLLQAIEQRYPNTFHGVQFRSKPMWQHNLEGFHVFINGFLETSMVEVSEQQISSLHEDLKAWEGFGLDLSWACKRLEMVEKLKFGNDPLRQELMGLEGSLESAHERLLEKQKQYEEAKEKLEKAKLEYNSTKKARNDKAQEMVQQFGSDYDGVLAGHIGFDTTSLTLFY